MDLRREAEAPDNRSSCQAVSGNGNLGKREIPTLVNGDSICADMR